MDKLGQVEVINRMWKVRRKQFQRADENFKHLEETIGQLDFLNLLCLNVLRLWNHIAKQLYKVDFPDVEKWTLVLFHFVILRGLDYSFIQKYEFDG